MPRWLRIFLLGFLALTAVSAVAAPLSFSPDQDTPPPPPVVADSTKARQCTVAFLVVDTSMNDVFAPRMQVDAAQDAKSTNGLYPCPTNVPPRFASRALDVCLSRAVDPKSCVFGDMSRGFEVQPEARNTAENTSRCASDVYSHIGIACWKSGDRDVCNVACGQGAQEAQDLARGRCEVKHQKRCEVIGSLPVLAPR